MPTHHIEDSRRLEFQIEAVLEAILQLDRMCRDGCGMPRSTASDLASSATGVQLTLTVTRRGERAPTPAVWNSAQIAAALIRLCGKLQVPLPRLSEKRIERTANGVALLTVSLPSVPILLWPPGVPITLREHSTQAASGTAPDPAGSASDSNADAPIADAN
jgi:hypothetical protein